MDTPEVKPQPELVDTTADAKKIIETLLFITDRPVKPGRLAEVVETVSAKQVLAIIEELTREYAQTGRAVQIVEVGGGFQMATKPEYGRWVRKLYNEKMTTKLSNAALETLAIIAYKQPITRAEMESIRGVDVAGPLERLLERGLVRVVGKKDTIGRPMVYGTTDEFLRMFGLNKVSELPDLQVFAEKTLHEKQADLPFDEALPPVGEPAIIPLDELEGAEKLEALDTTVDPFFTRTSYNKTALGQEALPGLEMPQTQAVSGAETQSAAGEPQAAAAETTAAGEVSAGEETPAETPESPAQNQPENPAQNQPENPAQNLPEPSGETAAQDPVAVAERQERLNNQILTVETEQEEAAAKGAAGEEK
ncbi:MAG: SMC-Scp complex subunit ScpB [Spirochaetota bacterium]|uniref:SMC-Scp complex subunit ScpB n=1 Tax=Candidatus Avelusimicrobium faecicola TaxID=3416205 RepID=UPI002A672188|nr:SMC-Scp complex subunit ScpB [Spirochaetota bacterium]MDY6128366.1 SMC-Scp complex subunit ScpB [Elusimicrobiaceae bacterium]